MSEHIVHTGVVEDSFALTQYLSDVPDDIKNAMREYVNYARLGSITVAGDQFSFRLLEEFRPEWKNRDEILEAKFAFVMGWISHRACDRQMKPIWAVAEMKGRGTDADPSLSPTECSVYHEGRLYNLYYAGDTTFKYAIFKEELEKFPGSDLFDLDELANYMEGSFAANMMNIQTFAPPPDDQRFIEDVCMRSQKFYVDVNRYKKAAGNPDTKQLHDFVLDINWYDENDEIVGIAKKLRNGGVSSPDECDKVLECEPASYYGKALWHSLQYFITVAEYYKDHSMSIAELKNRLDIGKKGPGGLGV